MSPACDGAMVQGTYRRVITPPIGKFAIVQRDEHCTLVPWREILSDTAVTRSWGLSVAWASHGSSGNSGARTVLLLDHQLVGRNRVETTPMACGGGKPYIEPNLAVMCLSAKQSLRNARMVPLCTTSVDG